MRNVSERVVEKTQNTLCSFSKNYAIYETSVAKYGTE
jgi:hypothetical protein